MYVLPLWFIHFQYYVMWCLDACVCNHPYIVYALDCIASSGVHITMMPSQHGDVTFKKMSHQSCCIALSLSQNASCLSMVCFPNTSQGHAEIWWFGHNEAGMPVSSLDRAALIIAQVHLWKGAWLTLLALILYFTHNGDMRSCLQLFSKYLWVHRSINKRCTQKYLKKS